MADNQPPKLAALEGQFQTVAGAPLSIGGWPDIETRQIRYAIRIPRLLSLLAYHDPNAVVRGLDEWPRADQPDPRIVHVAFQIMVGIGLGVVGLVAWYWVAAWRHRRRRPAGVVPGPWLLRALVVAAPLGFVAMEAGWIVTEVGRQPWIIYGILRTRDAVTPMPGLIWPLAMMLLVYAVLSAVIFWIMTRLVHQVERGSEVAHG